MRIQHNIMAMNAYRNYNTNTSALSSNLEKLSSGYKINRAGDDAAGLAISEKMRAQITGLEAASKNVKDGISLVKTAEGAMQEIQDMLNRMDYLATQSANGTYQDEVDREALQKEVNQLLSEIDRIADSANFNGIKLLDGTWDVDGKTKAISDAQAAVDAASQPAAFDTVYDDMSSSDIKDLMLDLVSNGGPGSGVDNVGTNTVLETEKVEYQTPSFQVSLNGVTHTMVTAGGTGGTGAITLSVGGTNIAITENEIYTYLDGQGKTVEDGTVVSGEDLAAVVANKIKTTGVGGTANEFNDGTYAWNVRADGENVVFEFADSNATPTTSLNVHYDVKLEGLTGSDVPATGGVYTTGVFTAGTSATSGTDVLNNADIGISVSAVVNGQKVTFAGTAGGESNVTAMETAIGNATATIDGKTVKLSDYFTVGDDGSNAFTLTSLSKGADGDSITSVTITPGVAQTDASIGTTTPAQIGAAPTSAWTAGTDAYKNGTNGYVNYGTEVVIAGVPSESEQLASTTLDFTSTDVTDGMKIRLGDQEYTFAVGADSAYKGAENVIDMTRYEASDLKADGGDADARAAAFSKLSEVAANNETFTVSHQANTAKIGLKQLQEVKDTTDMTTLDGFASYIGVSTVNVEETQANKDAAEAAKAEELEAAQKALEDAEGGEAKALNLQIGDTSDDFNQLGVKIGSMKTSALGIADLSISTAEDAAAAIDVIKNAINYVSSVRGDLGAYQNRLEHTANNLSVMTENITDAESTIRDTDIAEEMMNYTKNNILVQSAQAMLAQANAVPQGVLQLLG